jgi:hypothetical protein
MKITSSWRKVSVHDSVINSHCYHQTGKMFRAEAVGISEQHILRIMKMFFTIRHRIQTGSGAHPAYPLGTTIFSPPSSGEVKNSWSYTSTPPYFFMAWCLIKHKVHLHGVVLS